MGALREIDTGSPKLRYWRDGAVAVVSFDDSEFLAVAAVGWDGQMSVPSEWAAMPPTTPGQPNLSGQ